MVTPSRIVGPEPTFEESRQIREWWGSHYDELRQRFPDRFVAVRGDEVVADEPDLRDLYERLTRLGLDPREDVAIWVAELTAANQTIPSLLGWNLLSRFDLRIHGPTRSVTLERP